MLPSGSLLRYSRHYFALNVLVASSKYGYSSNFRPERLMMLWWLAQVGLETCTSEGIYCCKNSNPTRRDPVPDRA